MTRFDRVEVTSVTQYLFILLRLILGDWGVEPSCSVVTLPYHVYASDVC